MATCPTATGHQNLFDYSGTSMLEAGGQAITSRQNNRFSKLNGHYTNSKPNHNLPVVCPSCKGTGRLPKCMEQELVALIPYKDNRLKPRPIWPFIVLALSLLAVTLFTAGLMLFFMFPRPVTASTYNAIASYPNDSFALGQYSVYMNMSLNVSLAVNNSNYFSILVQNLNVTVFHYNIIVGNFASTPFYVSSFEHKIIDFRFNLTFKGADMIKVRNNCSGKDYTHMVVLTFLVSSSYSYLSHFSATTDTDWMYITCNYVYYNEAENTSPSQYLYELATGQVYNRNSTCQC